MTTPSTTAPPAGAGDAPGTSAARTGRSLGSRIAALVEAAV